MSWFHPSGGTSNQRDKLKAELKRRKTKIYTTYSVSMWVILAVGFVANEVMRQTGSWMKTLIFITLAELVVATVGIVIFATLIEKLLRNVRDDEHDQMEQLTAENNKELTMSPPMHNLCGRRHWQSVDCPW